MKRISKDAMVSTNKAFAIVIRSLNGSANFNFDDISVQIPNLSNFLKILDYD